MSAQEPLITQLVELLGISQATTWPPGTDEVVIIAVRPQPDNFRPLNIALRKAQAVRLLRDLESLLKVPVVVLAACLARASCGCSARVEVDRASDTDVDFQPRSRQPVSQREPPLPPLPVTVPPEPQPVIVTGKTVIFSYWGTHNETHIHVHDAPQRHVAETVVIRREVQAESRPIDRRCEQLRRDHDERVRRWKAFPLGE